MFSLGGVLYKDNGSVNRFVEISKLVWNCAVDGWLPPVSCSNIGTLFSHNCQHHEPGSKRVTGLGNNDKNVNTIQWEESYNNTFAIGYGLSNPEGLNTGGSSSGTKHALIVWSGVALSCQGTMPALRIIKQEIQGAGPGAGASLVTNCHFHKHPAMQSRK